MSGHRKEIMSYINIRKVTSPAVSGDEKGLLDHVGLSVFKPDHSLRDGEEIAACVCILGLLDSLDTDEALVITRDFF